MHKDNVGEYISDSQKAGLYDSSPTFHITASGTPLDLDNVFFQMHNDAENGTHHGIILLEGTDATTEPLVLEVREKTSGSAVATVELQLSISGVENMYVHKNLRHVAHDVAEGQQGGLNSWSVAPNWPDYLCSGTNFVMVHGINVTDSDEYGYQDGLPFNDASAPYRAVLSELFKRFWWSGQQERFCAVQWFGDEGNDGNYYQHVINAFKTAPALKNYINAELNGPSYVAGHSLGNMVVSSAIQDHGMNVEQYYMLNAAVAKEAYDAAAADHGHMIPDEWNAYSNRTWASQYYKLFDTTDDRSKLKWEGRFADVVSSAFNFYSSGDEVFETIEPVYPTSGATGDETFLFPYSWQKNEVFKGTDYGFDWTPLGTFYAGWGFAREPDLLISDPALWTLKYTVSEANALTPEQLKTNYVFRVMNTPSEMFQSTISDDMLSELLAKAIPATTRAAGKETSSVFEQTGQRSDMNGEEVKNNGWPSSRRNSDWRHNDLFEVAYPYVKEMFDKVVEER